LRWQFALSAVTDDSIARTITAAAAAAATPGRQKWSV
jgi:hypothetical protein